MCRRLRAQLLSSAVPIFLDTKCHAKPSSSLKIVKPRFETLAGATGSGNELLHQRMQRFLIVIAKDQAMREPLARQAALKLGLDGDPDPAAAPVSELETIFSIGVQDLGQPFFELLLNEAIDSQDPAFRNAAFGALARVEDSVLVEQLQAAVIERVPETFRSGIVPAFGSADRADEWQDFIVSHADSLPGYERTLINRTLGIEL